MYSFDTRLANRELRQDARPPPSSSPQQRSPSILLACERLTLLDGPQYDYLFAIGTIFALLDAYNIGANDVANSFATSVASKSLTMKQAALAASIMEFTGAVAVGARTADTIKSGIISSSAFQGNVGVQLLGFVCAIVVSGTWLMICTRLSWPVSTTVRVLSCFYILLAPAHATRVHSTRSFRLSPVSVSPLEEPTLFNGAGMVARALRRECRRCRFRAGAQAADLLRHSIFAGFLIAPAMAGGFAAIVYLLVKYGVLARRNPFPYALASGPLVFFTAAAVMTLAIVYKVRFPAKWLSCTHLQVANVMLRS